MNKISKHAFVVFSAAFLALWTPRALPDSISYEGTAQEEELSIWD